MARTPQEVLASLPKLSNVDFRYHETPSHISAQGLTTPHKERLRTLGFRWYGRVRGWRRYIRKPRAVRQQTPVEVLQESIMPVEMLQSRITERWGEE